MSENEVISKSLSIGAPEFLPISENMSSIGTIPSGSVNSTPKTGKNWSKILRWTAIILLLAFLGFNIFVALGKVTGGITEVLKPLLSIFGYNVGETTKQTVKMSSTGTKGAVDTVATTVESGIDVLEKGLTGKQNKKETTNIALKDAGQKQNKPQELPQPDEAGSRTQSNKALGKAGFCYIGEDRGFRSCIKVNESDVCMSGDIFPTRAVCVNPKLRL